MREPKWSNRASFVDLAALTSDLALPTNSFDASSVGVMSNSSSRSLPLMSATKPSNPLLRRSRSLMADSMASETNFLSQTTSATLVGAGESKARAWPRSREPRTFPLLSSCGGASAATLRPPLLVELGGAVAIIGSTWARGVTTERLWLLLLALGERERALAMRRGGDRCIVEGADVATSSSPLSPSSGTGPLVLDAARGSRRLRLRAAACGCNSAAKTADAWQARKSEWLGAPLPPPRRLYVSGPINWRELLTSCPSSWTKVV